MSFAASPKRLRVSRTGRFTYAFLATPLRAGTIGLKSTKRLKIATRKRYMKLAAKPFSARSTGKVKITFKLPATFLKALKRVKKLRFEVTARLAGRTFTAKLTLDAPRRRQRS